MAGRKHGTVHPLCNIVCGCVFVCVGGGGSVHVCVSVYVCVLGDILTSNCTDQVPGSEGEEKHRLLANASVGLTSHCNARPTT